MYYNINNIRFLMNCILFLLLKTCLGQTNNTTSTPTIALVNAIDVILVKQRHNVTISNELLIVLIICIVLILVAYIYYVKQFLKKHKIIDIETKSDVNNHEFGFDFQ
jgi:hypothetical protein